MSQPPLPLHPQLTHHLAGICHTGISRLQLSNAIDVTADVTHQCQQRILGQREVAHDAREEGTRVLPRQRHGLRAGWNWGHGGSELEDES